MTLPVPIAAQIDHVREVTLVGRSDLGFWTNTLQRESLAPLACDGDAEIHLVAVDARFLGKPFRELSISVAVETQSPLPQLTGARLLHAFNSSRLFACIERTMFSTPYQYGRVSLSVAEPIFAAVHAGETQVFNARRASNATPEPRQTGSTDWTGPIFLPDSTGQYTESAKLFFAELSGETCVYEFDSQLDVWSESAEYCDRWIPEFRQGGFTPREWHIRHSARHVKSKTIKRSRLANLRLA